VAQEILEGKISAEIGAPPSEGEEDHADEA